MEQSTSGEWLASASDRGVDIWDTQTWQMRYRISLNQVSSVRFDASASQLVVASKDGLASYRFNLTADGFTIGEREELWFPATVSPHHLAAAPDGRLLVVDELTGDTFQSTGSAWLLDRRSGDRQKLSHVPGLRYTALSADSRYAVTGTWLGVGIHVWDTATGKKLAELEAGGSASVAFSRDGTKLASASNSAVIIWQSETWQQHLTIASSTVTSCLAFAPDGRVLATVSGGSKLRLFDVATGELIANLVTNLEPTYVRWLAFSPDGRWLAMCCATDGLRVWDLGSLRHKLLKMGLAWQA